MHLEEGPTPLSEPKMLTSEQARGIEEKLNAIKGREKTSIANYLELFSQLRTDYFSEQPSDNDETQAGLSGLPDYYIDHGNGKRNHLRRVVFRTGKRQEESAIREDSLLAVIDREIFPGNQIQYTIDIDLGNFSAGDTNHAALFPKRFDPPFPKVFIERPANPSNLIENQITKYLTTTQRNEGYLNLIRKFSQIPSEDSARIIREFLSLFLTQDMMKGRMYAATRAAVQTRAFPQWKGQFPVQEELITETKDTPPIPQEPIHVADATRFEGPAFNATTDALNQQSLADLPTEVHPPNENP